VKELQKVIHAKMPRNKKMCKIKWNGMNSDYKKLSNYHKGTEHHTFFLELTMEECDKFHYSTKRTMKQ
jgi:hypothetical protein